MQKLPRPIYLPSTLPDRPLDFQNLEIATAEKILPEMFSDEMGKIHLINSEFNGSYL